jgi:hypothetical protein
MLVDGREAQSLEELQIVKFNQTKEGASELLPIGKLKSLEKLNLCSTWFPIDLKRVESDNDVEVSGAKDFERMIWLIKGSLTHLQLGNYIWDDLFVYIAEMCKELELVQINSTQLTDLALCHLLKRSEHLKSLDVSGCT